MDFFRARTVRCVVTASAAFFYHILASKAIGQPPGRILVPFLRGEVKVREIGHNSVRGKGLVNDAIPPDFENLPL